MALAMFLFFVGVTLVITYWAARRTSGASAFFAANRQIKGWQNGFAVAGDYMSAASFLGIAGIIAFQGYDGFMYSVGWLVAYLTVLLIVAEPLRNAGKYTMADVLAYRLSARPVRAMASLSTITVSIFYMIAQMVGAGALVALLLKNSGISFHTAVIGVGVLMIVYVVFGGMLATTWVQIIKAMLLMGGTILLSILVLAHFGFSFANFFNAIGHVVYHEKGVEVVKDFLQPGLRFKPPYGALDLISLAHPRAFLYGPRCQDRAHQRRVGHGIDWHVLYSDNLSGFWRGYDCGPRQDRHKWRHEHERATTRAVSGRRLLLCVHCGNRLRDHSRRGRRLDD